jgi:hypothetical protein
VEKKEKFKMAPKKKPKVATTPGFPNKVLEKIKEKNKNLDDYRSIVGKIINYM